MINWTCFCRLRTLSKVACTAMIRHQNRVFSLYFESQPEVLFCFCTSPPPHPHPVWNHTSTRMGCYHPSYQSRNADASGVNWGLLLISDSVCECTPAVTLTDQLIHPADWPERLFCYRRWGTRVAPHTLACIMQNSSCQARRHRFSQNWRQHFCVTRFHPGGGLVVRYDCVAAVQDAWGEINNTFGMCCLELFQNLQM